MKIGNLFSLLMAMAIVMSWAVGASATEKIGTRKNAREEQVTAAIIGSWPIDLHPFVGNQLGHFTAKKFFNRNILETLEGQFACVFCQALPSIRAGTLLTRQDVDNRWSTVAKFALMPDAKWADGTPLVAEDIAFAWEVFSKTGEGLAGNNARLMAIRSVDVIDALHFDITYDGIICDDQVGVPPPLPSHLERKIWQDDHNRYFENSLYKTQPENPGLYNGPYRIQKISNSRISLVRNQYWSGKVSSFEKAEILFVSDKVALENRVREGGIDVFTTLEFDTGNRLAHVLSDKYNAFYAPSMHMVHLRVNFDNPILADVRVRKALLYSVDRESLLASLLERRGTVAQGLLSPFMPGYVAVTRYPYSPEHASHLLDEAGWPKSKAGMRVNAQGEPLKIELRFRRTQPWINLAPRLQEAWQAAGIQVDLIEDQNLSGDALDTRKRYSGLVGFAQAFEQGWDGVRFWYHSKMIPSAENDWRGSNHFGVSIPKLDLALDHYFEAACDAVPRARALAEMQQAFAEDLPALPLWFGTIVTLSDKRLVGAVDMRTLEPTYVEQWRLNAPTH